MVILFLLAIAAASYLIGSISSAILVGRIISGDDIRSHGSGNAGATNTLRTMGKKTAAIVLLFDILKGVVVVLLAKLMSGLAQDPNLFIQLAAIAVIVGHNFPIYYGFKGGKGVATSLGVITVINPLSAVICLLFAIVLMVITKMVSLSVMLAAVLFPILIIFFAPNYFIFALVIVLLLVYRHRANIKRIVSGNENKISFDK